MNSLKTIQLQALTRTVIGKKVKKNRLRGQMPAVLYGHGVDSTPLFVDAKLYKKAFHDAGTSALVDLTIEDQKPIKVLFHEPQMHYLHGEPVHADFYAVKMSEKIETAVPINYTGVSAAVEEMEGNFITNKDELQIRCFPGDLIQTIEVDISGLATFDDQIKVSDVKVPETIELLDDPEEVIALVAAPITEEELEAELAEDTTAEAEAVAELGAEAPADGEEAAEGEAPVGDAKEDS